MPDLRVPKKLQPFLTKKKRFKIALGGRGGGKSQSIADILLFLAQTQRHKVGCFREYQNSIDDSVYSLLVEEIERMALRGFNTKNNQIKHSDGGLFKFKGLARNPESVKSMHGFTRFWWEEAQTASKESLKLLTPTLRTTDSELIFSLNPMSAADAISERFIEPYLTQLLRDGFYEDELHYITWINYYDNPWFPSELEQERAHDFQAMPRNKYNHVWLGYYDDTVEDSIIPTEWFEAAINAHGRLGFKPRGLKIGAHDPSDLGTDDKAFVVRHGSVITRVETRNFSDINTGCDWATDLALEEDIDHFTWDAEGVGIGLRKQVDDAFSGKHIDWSLFKGSETPEDPNAIYEGTAATFENRKKARTNKQTFKNKRAQRYWNIRDRLCNTYLAIETGKYIDPDKMLSFDPDIPILPLIRAELCRVPRKPNGSGLIQIMSKPEMRRLKIKSPNMADGIMMTAFNPTPPEADPEINFDSLWG